VEQPFCQIDDFGPLPVVQPQSAVELGEIVCRAAGENQAVYPLGGRTMLHVGLPPTKPGIGVDLRRLDQVIDYPARDMTITVQSGISLAKLQAQLKSEKQQLPVDIPLPDQATLGGALAVNCSGPRRYAHGTLRDYVIGISAVNDQGHEIKAGGRVVKNVAGYDLCKLYVGSFGTLGVITQVTLKLKPLPEDWRLMAIPCPLASLPELLDRLHGSKTTPTTIEVLNGGPIHEISQQLGLTEDIGSTLPRKWLLLLVGFEGNTKAVEWQLQQLRQELPGEVAALASELTDIDPEAVHVALANFLVRPGSRFAYKANILPRSVATFCDHALTLSEQLLLQAHAGNGIVIGQIEGDFTLDQAQEMLEQLQEKVTEAQGNVVVLRCPTEWKHSLPIWGAARGDGWLMRAVKDKLDPRSLFNPGRFVDGI
jgi:glycolate oxidase FAD binding subunit